MGAMITYKVGDKNAKGYLALPEKGSGPGVLVMHAWWGLTDFFTGLAERLAREGFVVLAPDLYDGRTADTIPDAEQLIGALDYRQAIKYEEAAAEYLLSQPAVQGDRIGAVGFSMGASYATWLAALNHHVAAVVLFYGGSEQGEGYENETNAAFLGHFVDPDAYESLEEARQLEQRLLSAGKEAVFHVYPGAGHWFFEGNRPGAYNPEAAALAWSRTVEFLHNHLDSPTARD